MTNIEADLKNRVFTLTMGANDLLQPSTELSELKFEGFSDWFICVTDPKLHWKYQPTYLISQAVFLFGALATLVHAITRGGRLPWLWFGITLHGVFVELICYIAPDVDNFWHSQTPIIFFGRRLPLHIIFLCWNYNCFIYNASIAVAKMKLPKWSEPFAVGLVVVLIDIPYDIVSVKFVHWFWHDTDPNIYDRHYWVPWNSYYFHLTFTASFTFWFHFLKRRFCATEGQWLSGSSFLKELITTVLAAVLGPVGGVLLFIPIYHPLHDVFKIHSEVTFFIILTVSLVLVWSGDRSPKLFKSTPRKNHWTTFLLVAHLVVHYTTFWLMPILFNPEDEVSTGIKEKIGPCNQYVPLQTVSGKVLQKRQYLCATDYDEKYFDWHCLTKPPQNGALWYTSCGTPFENRAEYITVISLISFLAFAVFYNLHFKSFGDQVFTIRNTGAKKTTKQS